MNFWLFFVITVGLGIFSFIRRSRAQVVTERLQGLEDWKHDDGKLAGDEGEVMLASHVRVHFPSMSGSHHVETVGGPGVASRTFFRVRRKTALLWQVRLTEGSLAEETQHARDGGFFLGADPERLARLEAGARPWEDFPADLIASLEAAYQRYLEAGGKALPRVSLSPLDEEKKLSSAVATCSACSATNDPDAVFCERCGRPMRGKCPSCGARNDADSAFCKGCGGELRDA
ncbi:MAG TPA: zinc ribbon domain-containing protein [Polyangiaceae bacterium]